jgi:hypothetical protein
MRAGQMSSRFAPVSRSPSPSGLLTQSHNGLFRGVDVVVAAFLEPPGNDLELAVHNVLRHGTSA